MNKKPSRISKKVLLGFIILLVVIALLLAVYLVKGFDAWLGNNVVNPIGVSVVGFVAIVASHPIWLQWGYVITATTFMIFGAFVSWLVFVKWSVKVPMKPLTGLQDKVHSRSQTIPNPNTSVTQKTIPDNPPTIKEEAVEVKAEA